MKIDIRYFYKIHTDKAEAVNSKKKSEDLPQLITVDIQQIHFRIFLYVSTNILYFIEY